MGLRFLEKRNKKKLKKSEYVFDLINSCMCRSYPVLFVYSMVFWVIKNDITQPIKKRNGIR